MVDHDVLEEPLGERCEVVLLSRGPLIHVLESSPVLVIEFLDHLGRRIRGRQIRTRTYNEFNRTNVRWMKTAT